MIRMKAILALALAVALALGTIFAGPAAAIDGTNALTYRGGTQGRVIFDGRTHAAKGLVCTNCHSALFDTARRGLITMSDHGTDKKCWSCHNGKQAFDKCDDCHRKVPSAQ
jgi:phosphate transport system substrate-binding protein